MSLLSSTPVISFRVPQEFQDVVFLRCMYQVLLVQSEHERLSDKTAPCAELPLRGHINIFQKFGRKLELDAHISPIHTSPPAEGVRCTPSVRPLPPLLCAAD